MTELILKRLAIGVLMVWLALSTIFFLCHGVGDPARAILGPQAPPAVVDNWRVDHRLAERVVDERTGESTVRTRPVGELYIEYFADIFQGNLQLSWRDDQPVGEVIRTRLPRTLLLSGMALSFEIAFGLILGTLAALRRGTLLDTGFMGVAFLGISLPTFVTGPIFLLVLGFRLGWFPIGGYGHGFWDHVYHGILPAFTIAIIGAATYARVMRSEMIETMQADYIRTARAKGLHPFQVVVGHGVRNAMLPIVTLMGLSFPLLVTGAIITEQIYNWTGMGRLLIESIYTFDIPIIMGVCLCVAIFVQLGNLLADVGVGLLDPRVRASRR